MIPLLQELFPSGPPLSTTTPLEVKNDNSLTLRCLKYIYQGNFQSLCRLAQLFLDTWAVILPKKSEIIEENFFAPLKMQLGRFY